MTDHMTPLLQTADSSALIGSLTPAQRAEVAAMIQREAVFLAGLARRRANRWREAWGCTRRPNRAGIPAAPPGGQASACRPFSSSSSAGASDVRSAGSPSGAVPPHLPAAGVSSTPPEGAVFVRRVLE